MRLDRSELYDCLPPSLKLPVRIMIRGRLKITFKNVSDDLLSTSHQCSLPASLISISWSRLPADKDRRYHANGNPALKRERPDKTQKPNRIDRFIFTRDYQKISTPYPFWILQKLRSTLYRYKYRNEKACLKQAFYRLFIRIVLTAQNRRNFKII